MNTPVAPSDEEQALIITVKLRSGLMGDGEERERMFAVQGEISAAIKESGAGMLDGDEFGGGTCTIYLYGPNADRLYSLAQPILQKFDPPEGSYVTKRYGKPGARRQRFTIAGEEIPMK
jgi:hypothetical protein